MMVAAMVVMCCWGKDAFPMSIPHANLTLTLPDLTS